MKTIKRDEFISSRSARERGAAPPLLTTDEKLASVKLELIEEVDADGVKIKEIIINRPTVDDMLDQQIGDGSKEETYRSLAKACQGVPPETIRTLHPRDFRYISEVYWAYQE